MSDVSEQMRSLYGRMHDAMVQLVKSHVVAIAAYYQGKLRHHATGSLVRFADQFFLVTAAHAIEVFDKYKALDPEIMLFLDNGDDSDLVRLYGNYHVTKTVRDLNRPRVVLPGERDDLWDVGFWQLDRKTVDSLTNKVFLNRKSISITDDLTSGVYYLAGVPGTWSQVNMEARCATWKWFRYIAHPLSATTELTNFDQRFHLALCLSHGEGLPTDYHGISGCPIWKLADLPVGDAWDVSQARIVAIQTCVYEQCEPRAIRGTRWQCAVSVLREMHPEIWDGFNLWLPGSE